MLHTENPNIKQFFPLVTDSLAKGMDALSNGDSNYNASSIEIYAQTIFSRVYEIDNALKNMSITMEYLRKKNYEDSEYNFSEHHAHHIENFLLRLTSVVDRSYKLAGSTIMMESEQIEKQGSNEKIYKKLLGISQASATILENMRDTIKDLRTPRNKVAHQAGFSSKNLCVLQAIENAGIESISVKEITDIMSYDKIKEVVSHESIEQYESVLLAIDKLVTDLINSLPFLYTDLLQSKSPVKN
ncbi:Cthe_2314 family HEPN domain-containing protein [Psychrobacter sp. UBA5136]|uniref:Cthe_2314 family HEPN domain-containing protein n=1 Tax=Psychrobacter sp. UBA5136 TaxID=1947356 RepID=UPI0025D75E76|nr:Cthe_2314 family HEPN domain-containing protein [Psychrobacter sp. UBA5136]